MSSLIASEEQRVEHLCHTPGVLRVLSRQKDSEEDTKELQRAIKQFNLLAPMCAAKSLTEVTLLVKPESYYSVAAFFEGRGFSASPSQKDYSCCVVSWAAPKKKWYYLWLR